MIPRVQTGSSFKGAGLYYLHDKREKGSTEPLLTKDRLAWTYALNTVEDEPEQVLAEMRQTSFDQPFLKLLSGNRADGRPTKKPVMTIALAWSPTQAPSQKQMIEAAKSYLEHMRWGEHQALLVAHNDTEHPHLHIILNRVHPSTGMGIDDSWRKHRSHQWGLAYERETGKVLCEARIGKYEIGAARRAPQDLQRREGETWQEIRREERLDPEFQQQLKSGEWAQLKDHQKTERLAFWEETKRLRKELGTAIRAAVRDEFKGEWATYTAEKAKRTLEAKAYDREARRAAKNLARAYSLHLTRHGSRRASMPPGADTQGMKEIRRRQKEYHTRLKDELRERRMAILARQKERAEELSRSAFQHLGADRRDAYNEVLATHRAERSELRQDQAAGIQRYDLLTGVKPIAKQDHVIPERELKERTDKAKADAENFRVATSVQASPEITSRPVHRAAAEITKPVAPGPPTDHPQGDYSRSQNNTGKRTKAADPARRRAAVDKWLNERRQRAPVANREVTDQRAAAQPPEQTERRTKESELARRLAAVDEWLGERKADRDRGGGGRDR